MFHRDVPRASETAWFRGGSCQTVNERGSQGVNGRGSQGRGTHFSSSFSGTPQRLPAEMRKQENGMAGAGAGARAGAGPCEVEICSLQLEGKGRPGPTAPGTTQHGGLAQRSFLRVAVGRRFSQPRRGAPRAEEVGMWSQDDFVKLLELPQHDDDLEHYAGGADVHPRKPKSQQL